MGAPHGRTDTDSDETQQLLARAGVGDPAAFEALFARHRDFLGRLDPIDGNPGQARVR